MFTTGTRNDKIEELRRQLEAAEAEKAAQDRQDQARLRSAQKAAGANHTRLVLALYDMLGLECEHGTIREVKGRQYEVAVDKDETIRTRRVFDMVSALIENVDESMLGDLRIADELGREKRRPKPRAAMTPADDAADDGDTERDIDDPLDVAESSTELALRSA